MIGRDRGERERDLWRNHRGVIRKSFLATLPCSTLCSLRSVYLFSIDPLNRTASCRREFETIVDGLSDALDFSQTIGVDASASLPYEQGGGRGTLGEVDFYTRCVYVMCTSYFTPTVFQSRRSDAGL